MLKKTITYTDYNGQTRTENFWFNLSKAELAKMELGTAGGWTEWITRIVEAQDAPAMIAIFDEIIAKAYGERSADGRQFIKSPELSRAFMQTEAYSELYMELLTNDKAAAEFMNGIIPQDAQAKQQIVVN